MNKKLIRLTENDLHRIVKESVNRVLKESNRYAYTLEIDNRYKPLWDKFTNELQAALDARQY